MGIHALLIYPTLGDGEANDVDSAKVFPFYRIIILCLLYESK